MAEDQKTHQGRGGIWTPLNFTLCLVSVSIILLVGGGAIIERTREADARRAQRNTDLAEACILRQGHTMSDCEKVCTAVSDWPADCVTLVRRLWAQKHGLMVPVETRPK